MNKKRKPGRKSSKANPTPREGIYVFSTKVLDMLGINSQEMRERLLKTQFKITADKALVGCPLGKDDISVS